MKFSKSILIFLLVPFILSAFYYVLKRIDGNVCKSIMFTMYFLAIKIGLIGPNIPLELNPHQPNQQLVSRIQTRAVYNPYILVLDNYRRSDLYIWIRLNSLYLNITFHIIFNQ